MQEITKLMYVTVDFCQFKRLFAVCYTEDSSYNDFNYGNKPVKVEYKLHIKRC